MSATARFSSRCCTDDVPGISSTFGATDSVQASAICAGVRPSFDGLALDGGIAQHRVVGGERGPEREERHERDAVFDAQVEYRL